MCGALRGGDNELGGLVLGGSVLSGVDGRKGRWRDAAAEAKGVFAGYFWTGRAVPQVDYRVAVYQGGYGDPSKVPSSGEVYRIANRKGELVYFGLAIRPPPEREMWAPRSKSETTSATALLMVLIGLGIPTGP